MQITKIKKTFRNINNEPIAVSEARIIETIGQESFHKLLDMGALRTCGIEAYNMMQTSINNWKYCNKYLLIESNLTL